MSYCYDHGFEYSGSVCPRCEREEQLKRIADAIADQTDAGSRDSERIQRMLEQQGDDNRDLVSQLASQLAERLLSPGEYQCPRCTARSLNVGAQRCRFCTAEIAPSYWTEVSRREEEAKAAELQRRRRIEEEAARAAENAAAQALREKKAATARSRVVGCLLTVVVLVSLGVYSCHQRASMNVRRIGAENAAPLAIRAPISEPVVLEATAETPVLASIDVGQEDLVDDFTMIVFLTERLCSSDSAELFESDCGALDVLEQANATSTARTIAAELHRAGWSKNMVPLSLVPRGEVAELRTEHVLNASSETWLVNGRPSFVRINLTNGEMREAVAKRPEWRQQVASLPADAKPATWGDAATFVRSEQLPSGEQRLTYRKPITDGCRACTVIGTVEFGFDISPDGLIARKLVTNIRLQDPVRSP